MGIAHIFRSQEREERIMKSIRILPWGTDKTNGTYLQGRLEITFYELRNRFGEPYSGTDNKTDAEWYLEIRDDNGEKHVATIYNWKNGKGWRGEGGRKISDITDWNIGGKSKKVVDFIEDYIRRNINTRPLRRPQQ